MSPCRQCWVCAMMSCTMHCNAVLRWAALGCAALCCGTLCSPLPVCPGCAAGSLAHPCNVCHLLTPVPQLPGYLCSLTFMAVEPKRGQHHTHRLAAGCQGLSRRSMGPLDGRPGPAPATPCQPPPAATSPTARPAQGCGWARPPCTGSSPCSGRPAGTDAASPVAPRLWCACWDGRR